MARVLVIEDNERLAGLIADGLAAQGHVCDAVHTLAAAEDALAGAPFDGIVLDLGLPDGDGVDWMRMQHGPRPPILVLTARDALEDRIRGLDAGADDYLPKPFAMSELAARLRALLRRPSIQPASKSLSRSNRLILPAAKLPSSNSCCAARGLASPLSRAPCARMAARWKPARRQTNCGCSFHPQSRQTNVSFKN